MLKSFQTDSRRVIVSQSKARAGLHTGLLTLAMASSMLLYSSLAAALGLGDITLHSALGQPFNADIELVETSGLSPDDIVVSLAPPEAFAKAGVERSFFLNDLRFTPVVHGNRGVVHVESRKAVTEPYVEFLVRLVRPSGDQLHQYSVLIDPPDSPAGMAATRGRTTPRNAAGQTPNESRMPVAPPQALQANHYTVAAGDTLASVSKRVLAPGSPVSAADLASGIQALNPQAFPNGDRTSLKAGQVLLLPDAALAPRQAVASATTATNSTAVSPAPAGSPTPPASVVAEQLAASAIENQQLSKSLDDLKGQVQIARAEDLGKTKQIAELQTQLAELKAAAKPAPTVAVPVASPAPVAVQPVDDSINLPMTLGGLFVVLLLLVLVWSIRRNRVKTQRALVPEPQEPVFKSATAIVTPVFEVPAVTPQVVTSAPAPPVQPASAQRLAGASTDALDGASIYIAYGRFAEALAILRDALDKQPQRTDIRMRILELLGEQGDVEGFNAEEKVLLNHGIDEQKLVELRNRYPKLQLAATPAPQAQPTAPTPQGVNPLLAAGAAAAVVSGGAAEALAKKDPEPAAIPSSEDEFQLNLDDLAMDADWDLVDPFDSAPARKPAPVAPPAEEPMFASNLTQLPEVFEMPDEQFLSDFAEADEEPEVEFDIPFDASAVAETEIQFELPEDSGMDLQFEPEPEPVTVVQSNSDLMDDAFLDSFMIDEGEFDLLGLEDEPLSPINQAQVLIDDGNFDEARRLLGEVIENGDDEAAQQTARDLLARLS